MQESADSLFSVLSAVLWLGNLRYRGERDDDCLNDSAALADSDAAIFRTIAALLNVDYAQLVQVQSGFPNTKLSKKIVEVLNRSFSKNSYFSSLRNLRN